MALLTRKSVLAAKIETTSGTYESMTNSECVITATNASMSPNFEILERPQQGSFQRNAAAIGLRGATCTFRTDWYGDGADTAPAWAEQLLPACALTQTAEAFAVATEAPGTNVKTLSLAHYLDGKVYKMSGAVGTFQVNFETGKPVTIDWTFTGKWEGEADDTLLTPTPQTRQPMRFANATFGLSAWAPCLQSLTLNIGNVVQMRECQNGSETGYLAGIITDRVSQISFNPESDLVATHDLYTEFLNSDESKAFSIMLTDGSDSHSISSAGWQVTAATMSDRGGIATDDVTMVNNSDAISINFAEGA